MKLTNLTGEELRDLCRRHNLRGHSYYTKVAQLARFMSEHANYEAVRAELEKIAAGELPRPRDRKVDFVPSPSLPLPPATPNPEDEGDDDEPIRFSPPSRRDCRISKSDWNLKPKELPILFSGRMVRAILSGQKTQTRRVVKPQPFFTQDPAKVDPDGCWYWGSGSICAAWGASEPVPDLVSADCPYGQRGDRLWVRETWCRAGDSYIYAADFHEPDIEKRWKPSIHMPREVCRLKLGIFNVRLERLQDISGQDAIAEGCPGGREEFNQLWDAINNNYRWNSNPWVWVVEFRRIELDDFDAIKLSDVAACC